MDYEKAYKDALKRAKNLHKDAIDMGENIRAKQCEIIFPELKESEDEMVRKAIHIYLDWLDGRKDYAPKGEYSIKDMLAWLEKQGKQKPSWSEEDEKRIKKVMHILSLDGRISNEELKSILDWLKSIKERVQPKQEWSEDDIRNIDNIDSVLFYDKDLPEDTCVKLRNWLKSLRPKNR